MAKPNRYLIAAGVISALISLLHVIAVFVPGLYRYISPGQGSELAQLAVFVHQDVVLEQVVDAVEFPAHGTDAAEEPRVVIAVEAGVDDGVARLAVAVVLADHLVHVALGGVELLLRLGALVLGPFRIEALRLRVQMVEAAVHVELGPVDGNGA